jgi:hypothetical protein
MTTEPENLPEGDYEEEEYYGDEPVSSWGLFAGMMLFGVSMFAFLAMCIGWGVPNMLQYTAFGMTVDWLWYGLFDGLTAIVAFFAAGAVWQGRKIGYYLGLIIATLSAGRWFLFIPAVPFWGAIMLVVWVLVIYGLVRDREYFK